MWPNLYLFLIASAKIQRQAMIFVILDNFLDIVWLRAKSGWKTPAGQI